MAELQQIPAEIKAECKSNEAVFPLLNMPYSNMVNMDSEKQSNHSWERETFYRKKGWIYAFILTTITSILRSTQ